MIRCLIFDLSEVLIAGLVGVEKRLSSELSVPEEEVLAGFGGNVFKAFLRGDISEQVYLEHIIGREGWQIGVPGLQEAIRDNFHNQVAGSLDVLRRLYARYALALHSDHAREWVAYIRSIHPFIELFGHKFFSYELKALKTEPGAFRMVLEALALPAQECLFIDDNATNVEVARSVGIPSVRFQNAGQLAKALGELGVG